MKKTCIMIIIIMSGIVFSSSKINNQEHKIIGNYDIFANIKNEMIEYSKNEITNKAKLVKLSTFQNDNYDNNEEKTRIQRLIKLSEVFFENFNSPDPEMIFLNELSEEKLKLAYEMLRMAFAKNVDINDTNKLLLGTHTFRVRIYAQISAGWFYGNLYSSALSAAIMWLVAKVITIGATAGIIGVIIGAVIGSTLGSQLEKFIDFLIYRDGKAGFVYDIWNYDFNLWSFFNGFSPINFNIYDLIFYFIKFSGGNWTSTNTSRISLNLPPLRVVSSYA